MRQSVHILLGIVLCLAGPATILPQEIYEQSPGVFTTPPLHEAVAAKPTESILIRSAYTLHGTLRIMATPQDSVSVSYRKKAATDSRSRAIDFIDLIAVSLERGPQDVTVKLRARNPAPWLNQEMGLVDADLSVPLNSRIEIDAPYFDVTAVGPFEAAVVPSSMGRLYVSKVAGRLHLETVNQKVEIESVSGDILVTTSNALLTARDILSPESQAKFRNTGGDILIDGVTGELSVRNEYGRIEIRDFEPHSQGNLIRGFSGPISVDITHVTDGQVIISNRYEDIDVNIPVDLSARLSLAVDEGGRITADNFPFKTDFVQPTRLNLVAGEGQALISATIRGRGNIYVAGEEAGE